MLNGPSDESPLQEWDRMVDINLRGLMSTIAPQWCEPIW
jgi:NADP-dependent 3-hydroxy acid dehydrogenase YdfG